MTPGNKIRLEKAARELAAIANVADAQLATLAILRTLEILNTVLTDLVFRPEVNTK